MKKKYEFITDLPFWRAMSKRNRHKKISIEYFNANGNGATQTLNNNNSPPRLLKIISLTNKK